MSLSLVATLVVLASPPAYVKTTPAPVAGADAYRRILRDLPRVPRTNRPVRARCGTIDVHFEELAIGGGKFGPTQLGSVWDPEPLDPCKIPPATVDAKKYSAAMKLATDQVHPRAGDVLAPTGDWEVGRDDAGNLARFLTVRLYSKNAPVPYGDQCGNEDKSRNVVCWASGNYLAKSYDVQKARLVDAQSKSKTDKNACRAEAWAAVLINSNMLYLHAAQVKDKSWDAGRYFGTVDGILDEETTFARMGERSAAAEKLLSACGGSASEIPDKQTNDLATDM